MWSYVNSQKEIFLYSQMENKYITVYKEIKSKIYSGEYPAGSRLPSKRRMADLCGYSLITVEKAYAELADEGLVLPSERRGYFVSAHAYPMKKNASPTYAPLADTGHFPPEDFPYSVWFRTVRKVLSEAGERLFVPAPPRGCAVLRNALSAYLARYRDMQADPHRIVIGSGSEQLYETAAKMLGRNKLYGIERPSYHKIYDAYTSMGCRVVSLPLGTDGLSDSVLESAAPDVLHVTPFHSFPTGITTPLPRRLSYLSYARRHGAFLVEDDYDSEFFRPGHPIRSLYSLDTADTVLYINTFSRSLSPAMRIGYMILPESLSDTYEEKTAHASCSVPVMDQYILAEFINSGAFERHLGHVRRKMLREKEWADG